MIEIQAVFFDQGNVLDSHKESDKALAEHLGLSFDEFVTYARPHIRALHLGLDELEFLNRVRRDAGKGPTTERIFRRIYDAKRPLDNEMLEVNAQLRGDGLMTGIISNAEVPLAHFLAEKYGLTLPLCQATSPLFDTIICSCEVGLAKPDPEIYLLGCEHLGIKPKDAVFIDDSIRNVEGFQKLGGYGIHHVENKKTILELSKVLGYTLTLDRIPVARARN